MFAATYGKGFQMIFENGVSVSVQFGVTNYSSNRKNDEVEKELTHPAHLVVVESETAEVNVTDKNGKDILQEFDNTALGGVLGWQSPEKVLEVMNWAKNYTS